MSDTAPNNASSSEARIIDERVQGALSCSSRACPTNGWVDDATAAASATAGQAKKVLGKVLGKAAQQAWSQAGGMAEDVVDAGRRATKSVSRQIEGPLMVALVGFALGYLASLRIHKKGGRPARTADDKANIKVPSP